jgi:hypothetical protein
VFDGGEAQDLHLLNSLDDGNVSHDADFTRSTMKFAPPPGKVTLLYVDGFLGGIDLAKIR